MKNNVQLVGIITINRNLVITSWGGNLEKFTGISSDKAEGKILIELFPDIKKRGLTKYIEEVLNLGTARVLSAKFHKYFIPIEIDSKYFDKMQQLVTIAPIKTENEIVGAIITIEDVTKRLEEEYEIAKKLKSENEKERMEALKKLEELEDKDKIVETLSDESWKVRKEAVKYLKNKTDIDLAKNLVMKLKEEHSNLSILNSILSVLSSIDIDIVELLSELLKEEDSDLKIYTLQLLSEHKDPRVEDLLISALNDPNPNVKFTAIEGLGKIRSEKALTYFLNIIEKRDFYLTFPALEALKHIKNPIVIPNILPLLDDNNYAEIVLEILGELGDDKVVEVLIEKLNNKHEKVLDISKTIYKLYEKYRDLYGEGEHIKEIIRKSISPTGINLLIEELNRLKDDEEIKPLVFILSCLDNPLVEKTLIKLIGNPKVRNEIIEFLIKLGSRIVPSLIERLKDEDLETRFLAVTALGRIGDASAVPYLIEALKDRDLTVITAGALAKIGDRRAFEPLLDFLGDPDPYIRQAVISALNSIGHPDMPKRIKELLKSENPIVRESAVKIAGYFGYEECKEEFFKLIDDPEESVRKTVYENIVFFEDERVPKILEIALDKENNKIREQVAKSLKYLDEEMATKLIKKALKDAYPWVRYYAVKSLIFVKPKETLEILIFALQEENNDLVKIAIIEALGDIGDKKAITILKTFLKDNNKDILRATIHALGKIDHPDTIYPLIEMLSTHDDLIKIETLKAISNKKDKGAVENIQWLIAMENKEEILREGTLALAKMGTESSLRALLNISLDTVKRDYCISALSTLSEDKIDLLVSISRQMQSFAKITTILALERIKKNVSEYIFEFLKDEAPEVRIQALMSLRNLGFVGKDSRILEIYKKEKSNVVKEFIESYIWRNL